MGTYHEVNRYVDADELVQWFMSNLENYLMENPEDVAPIVHAHWIEHGEALVEGYRKAYVYLVNCSNCGRQMFIDDYNRYCPNCGAVMDEVKKDET